MDTAALPVTDPEGPPPYHPSAIKQWAKRVVNYSSQYNSSGWSANMALGEPRVWPQHGDIHGAWASSDIDSHQFIEVEFEVPVTPTAINIYETFHPGACVAVKAIEISGHSVILWSTNRATCMTSSRIFSPPLKQTRIKTNQIRLEMDCTVANTWCEIDAIQLVGIRDGAVAPVDDTALIEDLKSLVNQHKYSDVEFRVHGEPLYGHRALLAARSKYFCSIFKGSKNEIYDFNLPGLTKDVFIALLTFVYTNRLPIYCDSTSLVSLCKVSPMFDIPDLKTAAMYKLLGTLKCDNVVELYKLVQDDKSLDDVKSLSMKFMADHLKDMTNTESFESLPQSVIVTVVQQAMSKLNMNG